MPRGFLSTALRTLALCGIFTHLSYGQVHWQSQRQSSTSYNNTFELPPITEWEGETKYVEYIPPPETNNSWRVSGATINIDSLSSTGPPIRERPPIELTSFVSWQGVNNSSTVAETPHDIGRASHNHSVKNGEEALSYAYVRSVAGSLLGFAEGYATQDASADDYTMRSNGRIFSTSDMLKVLAGDDSLATSNASAQATAEYHLTQAHDFILDYTLSTEDRDADFHFKLTDVKNNEIVIDTSAEEDEQRLFQFCGTLLPGTYELSLQVTSDSRIETYGTPNFGGFGEFDLYFHAFNPHGEIIPVLHPSEERTTGLSFSIEDYTSINLADGIVSFAELDLNTDDLIVDVPDNNTPMCDPNSMGDVDGSGDVTFGDFLIQANNFGQPVADHTAGDVDCSGYVGFVDFLTLANSFGQAVGAAPVPEPSGFTLIAFAGLMIGGLRRRS